MGMYYRCQLTFELNRMVELYKDSYKFKILKKAVESLETEDNSFRLFTTLRPLNDIYKITLKDIWKENGPKPINNKEVIDSTLDYYLEALQRKSMGDIVRVYRAEYTKDLQDQIFRHWSKSVTGYDSSEKSFIEVFDEIHNISIVNNAEIFTIRLGKLENLYRVQRGQHQGNYMRMIPSHLYVKNTNRWNPMGVAFQYLGYADQVEPYDEGINMIEKACCEEIRLTKGEDVTTCKFEVVNKKAKIINFCYEDIISDDLERKYNDYLDILSKKETRNMLNKRKDIEQLRQLSRTEDFETKLAEFINKEVNHEKITKNVTGLTEIHLAQLLMKLIDEAVFLPVDKKDDPELKAYIPFHDLAQYLQDKGYSGISYKSTRMNKIGLTGKNLVLFNTEDASPIEQSMKVFHYNGKNYVEIGKSSKA